MEIQILCLYMGKIDINKFNFLTILTFFLKNNYNYKKI